MTQPATRKAAPISAAPSDEDLLPPTSPALPEEEVLTGRPEVMKTQRTREVNPWEDRVVRASRDQEPRVVRGLSKAAADTHAKLIRRVVTEHRFGAKIRSKVPAGGPDSKRDLYYQIFPEPTRRRSDD